MADWSERYKGKFLAAARVSARQLRDPRLVKAIETGLAHHKVPAALLQVEVPPAALIDAPQAARQALEALDRSGVRVGIHDFGTGQSSLGQVRGVPCQSMTLAKSLLTDLYTDPWSQGVTAAVLAMAKAMHIRSVADGIEDSATVDMLRALGCEQVQGQYVSPPMKAKDFEYWLECGGATHLGKTQLLEIDATPVAEEPESSEEDAYWAQVEAERKSKTPPP
jgi:EAL domain-containing protein (putative c-di-GMP-specific phosphodiesterase class I)